MASRRRLRKLRVFLGAPLLGNALKSPEVHPPPSTSHLSVRRISHARAAAQNTSSGGRKRLLAGLEMKINSNESETFEGIKGG